ncbi:MAG: dihydroneopterin aldolase [Bacteroidales bacterium]|nr:dihydroneopterin aldolase [Bacteroidales bacterium]
MGKIILENIEVYAYHGHFAEENKIGGSYKVSLELDTAFDDACVSDKLKDTYDYKNAYDIVVREMQKPAALIEHVAYRIVYSIFESTPLVWGVRIRLSKINPPVGGKLDAVTIDIYKEREK